MFSFSVPSKAADKRTIGCANNAALAIAITNAYERHNGHCLLVVQDTQTALKLQGEVNAFLPDSVHIFPDWETLPYDNFSPHQDIISDRLAHLYRLPQLDKSITIVPVNTLLQRLTPRSFIHQHALMVKTGDTLSLEKLRLQLEKSGYRHVDQVMEHGEYASRGSLIDLFPMGSQQPYRIDFFDDEVDTIRQFDPENQRSTGEIDHIALLPAHEFPTDDLAIEQFRIRWRERFEARREAESIYQQVSARTWPAGIEYWQPLFFEQTDSLFDYLPDNTLLMTLSNIEQAANQFLSDAEYRYDQRKIDPLRPLLPPSDLWLRVDEMYAGFKTMPQLQFTAETVEEDKQANHNLALVALPDLLVNQQLKEPLSALRKFTEQHEGKVIFSVESQGRREALLDLLNRIKLRPIVCDSLEAALNNTQRHCLIISRSEQGFIDPECGVALICEANILGQRVVQRRRRDEKKTVNPDTIIRNLAELQPGQPVVHLDHGIGRYLGLQTLDAGGMTSEFVTLEYQGGSKLYVPVSSLHMISRYSGGAEESAPLHKLGGEAWQKARKKAAEKVRDVAAELLDVYAKREMKPGHKFHLNREAYAEFCTSFPFEETHDQALAINAVLSDMCQPKAMDRLVCGDVGFGKTEVAMRAAFVSVENSKQVAVLVPTTLLAQQHFENFRDRFANMPIRVEVLSRFKTPKEQKQILADSQEGKIDILIGTHKILSTELKFKDLGLLIVDEEHRFGVRQKEKVKAMRADVDILTLTATPIPRTLNMAMSGMRDLSIIATPPARRMAIKTFVRQNDSALIREGVLREIARGGQVYFLHNNVDSIEKTADNLAKLIPEARITTAHGQMRERELERIMSDFYHQRFNVLVCTTIIETGIDVPTANTIIMDRADNLGLAQLHQLRGRVGRSHHQAYAYLLTPHPKSMTKDAQKRLEAIASLEDLGAGFTLATHDLEIRGAGELLGDEQSGQIQTIGFTLYMEMLEQAVEALKEGKEPALDDLLRQQSEVEMRIPALLPDDYIPDVNTRLSLYKRIASAEDETQLIELRIELIDRFGLLPTAAKNLLEINKLKLQAATMGISKIEASEKGGVIEFNDKSTVDPMYLVGLLQKSPQQYRMDGPNRVKIIADLKEAEKRLSFMNKQLVAFSENRQP
ncbi:transcription-repair coupling factor [Thaumasiovibrio sp. DFM-14]|uniref:transcription-repair coupling factor n=1 Tax=Thaumasiovibrio sp. DFM-14 TaxID=3384792 RepID=UPI0039A37F89